MATTALFLPGWDEQSIIGHDELAGGWFAQLWRNGSTSDPSRGVVTTQSGSTLFGLILSATGVSDVDLEMASPRPWAACPARAAISLDALIARTSDSGACDTLTCNERPTDVAGELRRPLAGSGSRSGPYDAESEPLIGQCG